MRRSRAFFALVGILLLALAGCGNSSPAPESTNGSTSSASPLPTFTATTLGGDEFSSGELQGRPSVLWFWAPWCTTCRAEAPQIAAAASALGSDVEIIGVGALGPVSDMEAFIDDTDLAELRHIADEDALVWADFGVAAQPAFAFIGADGSLEIVQGSLGADQIIERARELS